MVEAAAPTFTTLIKTESDISKNEVSIYLGTANDKGYRLDLAGLIVPPLIGQLYARAFELKPAADPDELQASRWPIRNMRLAIGETGPVLIMDMPGSRIAGELDRVTLEELYQSIGAYLSRVHAAERGQLS